MARTSTATKSDPTLTEFIGSDPFPASLPVGAELLAPERRLSLAAAISEGLPTDAIEAEVWSRRRVQALAAAKSRADEAVSTALKRVSTLHNAGQGDPTDVEELLDAARELLFAEREAEACERAISLVAIGTRNGRRGVVGQRLRPPALAGGRPSVGFPAARLAFAMSKRAERAVSLGATVDLHGFPLAWLIDAAASVRDAYESAAIIRERIERFPGKYDVKAHKRHLDAYVGLIDGKEWPKGLPLIPTLRTKVQSGRSFAVVPNLPA